MFKQKNSTKLETESIKSRVWTYFDAFILVIGEVAVIVDNNADVALVNYESHFRCKAAINNFFKRRSSTKFETGSIILSLWDYFGALS